MNILDFNAKSAKFNSERYVSEKNESFLKEILESIRIQSLKGLRSYAIFDSIYRDPYIISELESRGFSIVENDNDNYQYKITW